MKEALASFARIAVPAIADWCLIHVRDGDAVELAACEGADPAQREIAITMMRRYPPQDDPRNGIYRVLAGGAAELYEEVTDEMLAAASIDADQLAHTRALGYRSAMVVPLPGSRGVLGAMTFVSSRADRHYRDADLATAIHLGALAGGAIESASLVESERAARRDAERLQALTVALASTLEVGAVARTMVDAGMEALGAVAGFAWLLDETGTVLELAAHTEDGPQVERFRRFSVDAPIPLCTAMRQRQPLMFESLDEMASAYPAVLRGVTRFGAWATLPFLHRDGALGGVSWSFAQPTHFSATQRGLLDTMVQQTSLALERCRLLDAERAARDKAMIAERKKDEFLAVLGHELRNPMAPLATAVDLMRMKDTAAFRREREVIERAVAHLTRLIDDLLDVSRITRGLLRLARAEVDLADAVARAIEMASPLYEERRHHLRVDVPAGALIVAGDAVRLSQIFANLLTNAAKYTPAGGHVAIEARRDGTDALVSISDDGPGIAPELMPHVFEMFVQGPRALDRGAGGLGIGLTLVKRLVELHGGSVGARSEGRGTEITVRVPLAVATTAAVPVPPPRATTPRRILVVDDNRDAAEMLAETLRGLGHQVAVAYDGPSALELAGKTAPEICVLDLGLPVMDGYEIAERLRQRDDRPILIALTGYGQDSDRTRTRAAGFAHHLVKPVDLATLEHALRSGPDPA